MKWVLAGVLPALIVASTVCNAAPKKKVFNNPAEQVFQAALKAAREHHVVTYIDRQQLMFTFETGKSMSSYGNKCTAGIDSIGADKAEMIINTQTKSEKQLFAWGAGGRLANDMFRWTEENLRTMRVGGNMNPTAESQASPSDAKTSSPDHSGFSKVKIQSAPPGAEIEVDGKFMGSTPSVLQLPPGEHNLKLAKAGLKWERAISTTSGGEVSIDAALESDDSKNNSTNAQPSILPSGQTTAANQVIAKVPFRNTPPDAGGAEQAAVTSGRHETPGSAHTGGATSSGARGADSAVPPPPKPSDSAMFGENHGGYLGATSTENPRVRRNGVTLSAVEPNGPAYQAGLQSGDLILTLDGKYLYTVEELSAEVQKHDPGSRITIGYMRGATFFDT